ncbi:mitochondrial Homoaconitase [Batrachochytrium dendrobatidis]|nr:mitochondrial Homoaconitase [Batrachochytrium dendrobatidis]KAK5671763.1 mitochondrial Homoaconitase [Batrachochytrium dendrobatidis]
MAASLLKHPPQTLIEKIVQKYTVQQPIDSSTAQKVPRFKPVYQGEFVAIRPHKVMTHDNTGAVISK